MYFKRLINLDPGNKGSGGAESFTTLEELEGDPITGAGNDDTPEDPPVGETEEEKKIREDKEAAKVEEDKVETQRLADEAKSKPAKKDPPADKPEDAPKEDEPDEAEVFWDQVDKLKGGEPLEIDFGDVDPLTPEGIVIRDRAIEADAIDRFENALAERYPRSYALLEHEAAGGKFEDFFEKIGKSTELPTEAQLENDIAAQEAIVTQNLKRLGNTDKQVQAIIKAAKLDDELEEQAKEALTAEKKFEEDNLKAIREESDKANKQKATASNQMIAFVNAEVSTGEIDGITIPEKDRIPFAQAFLNSVRYADGKFIMTTELNNDNFKEVFKEKFFSYKKGNLGDLVVKAAKTENAVRLRATIKKNEKPKGESGNGQTFTSMSDVD